MAFFVSIPLNRFCVVALAFLTPMYAASPALVAAARAKSLDSFVGGGMGMLSWEGLCGSSCGWRFRSLEPWIADIMGLMC
jgi:hypothetical protein